jgi:hypothetical protein
MSFFSSMFQKAKGAIVTGVSFIPVVGGVAAGVIDRIHTGDEHQDASGQWISNSSGMPTTPAPNAQAQAEIDRVRAVDAAEIERLRQSAAETAAKLGGAATAKIANALDPTGAWYKQPAMLAAGGVLLVLLVLLASRGKR